MAAITNTTTITYADHEVGGDGSNDSNQPVGTYQIHGPYVLDKSFTTLRLVFDVIVVANSVNNLYQHSDTLETNFTKRDQDLLIKIGTSTWTYESGKDIINVASSVTKSGNLDTDRGYSRSYAIVIEAEFNSSSTGGSLRDIEFTVDYEPSRRLVLSIQGVYMRVKSPDLSASAAYLASTGADAEATTFTNSFTGKTFELVDEQYSFDRLDNLCQFSRQYSELIFNQSEADLDHASIRDHKVTFTDLATFQGAGREDIRSFRRVVATYDSGLDVSVATNIQSVVETVVVPFIKAKFLALFSPPQVCVEDFRHSYDETDKRLSVSMQFVFVPPAAGNILEVTESVAYREQRTLDLTPVHGESEFAAYVDVGWATAERISTRSITMLRGRSPVVRNKAGVKLGGGGVVGGIQPRRRIGKPGKDEWISTPYSDKDLKWKIAPDKGRSGPGTMRNAVMPDGWNIISSSSQVTDSFLGDPSGTEIPIQVLVETVVERYSEGPKSTRGGIVSKKVVKPGGGPTTTGH